VIKGPKKRQKEMKRNEKTKEGQEGIKKNKRK